VSFTLCSLAPFTVNFRPLPALASLRSRLRTLFPRQLKNLEMTGLGILYFQSQFLSGIELPDERYMALKRAPLTIIAFSPARANAQGAINKCFRRLGLVVIPDPEYTADPEREGVLLTLCYDEAPNLPAETSQVFRQFFSINPCVRSNAHRKQQCRYAQETYCFAHAILLSFHIRDVQLSNQPTLSVGSSCHAILLLNTRSINPYSSELAR